MGSEVSSKSFGSLDAIFKFILLETFKKKKMKMNEEEKRMTVNHKIITKLKKIIKNQRTIFIINNGG